MTTIADIHRNRELMDPITKEALLSDIDRAIKWLEQASDRVHADQHRDAGEKLSKAIRLLTGGMQVLRVYGDL